MIVESKNIAALRSMLARLPFSKDNTVLSCNSIVKLAGLRRFAIVTAASQHQPLFEGSLPACKEFIERWLEYESDYKNNSHANHYEVWLGGSNPIFAGGYDDFYKFISKYMW